MKTNTIKTLLVAAFTMAALSVPGTANAQLGGLVNKAKKKAEQVVDKKKEDVKKEVKKAKEDAKMKALDTQRPPLPWTMAENGEYNGMTMEDFVLNLAYVPEEEVRTLREQMDARFLSDCQIDKINSGPDFDVKLRENIQKEKERWWKFYGQIVHINNLSMQGVTVNKNGSFNTTNAQYFVHTREGGPRGIIMVRHNGKFKFATLGGDGAFLNDQEMNAAVNVSKRTHQFQILTKDVYKILDQAGEKYDETDRYMYEYSTMYATAIDEALAANTPENIEYKPMPKAGAMHAKFKAEVLAIAKADDPEVIDVIITSSDWDVKMNGLVPERRNIYGYIITQDKHGKICKDRMWTEKYQGNGNYGKLKAGGVGVSSDFYVR